MSANSIESCLKDYFAKPPYSEEVADTAYRNFVKQGAEAGNDFAHWIDTQAWLVTFQLREHVAGEQV